MVLAAILLLGFLVAPPQARSAGAPREMAPARLTFLVTAPPDTPAGDTLWISGSVPELGSWSGAGLRLRTMAGGRHSGSLKVPPGTVLEFKVTRGSWLTVEKDSTGRELPNRSFMAQRDDTLRLRVAAWRDRTRELPRESTLTGDIRRHPHFGSRHVAPRDVLVYLPPGYERDTTTRYPVLYFQDGQNVFDAATSFLGVEWGVDEAAEEGIRAGRLPPFIAVAVSNTSARVDEYTPARSGEQGGKAADYAHFLLEELKPFVDRTYRTRTGARATGVVGSSLGAVISLYLGEEHPGIFGLVGCLSPAAGWAERDLVRRAAAHPPGLRLWVDVGTRELPDPAASARVLEDARALRGALERAGYRVGADLHYEEIEGAQHNERAWAARIGRVLEYLLERGD